MPLSPEQIMECWQREYEKAPATLARMSEINTLAAAFNANVDSVVKISGAELQRRIIHAGMTLAELKNDADRSICQPEDVLRGIFRCFTLGIAEEWIAQDKEIYRWMKNELGTEKLQMGAQAGIIANTMSLTGIGKVITHVGALPELQARQFFKRDNLLSFDQNGTLKPAYTVNRPNEEASIHWIIEFDRDDRLELEGQTFICPKSNRFIATYDPVLFNLLIDPYFVDYTCRENADYIILSGYQALSESNRGTELVKKTIPIIEKWRQKKPRPLIHLEIASTQDAAVREAVARQIMPLVDSAGFNEREALDLLNVLGCEETAAKCHNMPRPAEMFEALAAIKRETGCPRLQLHMFGLYITMQNPDFPVSPEANRRGMVLAATAAASKALLGQLADYKDFTAAAGLPISACGINGLKELAETLGNSEFVYNGIGKYCGFDIIAVPAVIIDRPKTLVGMGDTISAFSLLGAR